MHDTGAGNLHFKENTIKNRFPEKITIQRITDQKISIMETMLVPFELEPLIKYLFINCFIIHLIQKSPWGAYYYSFVIRNTTIDFQAPHFLV